jgi:hypothetical protein
VLLLCFVASLQISIAAANILLAVMMVCWLAQMVQEKDRPAGAAILLAACRLRRRHAVISAFSLDPGQVSLTTSNSCSS